MQIDHFYEQVFNIVVGSNQHLWIATDVLRKMGVRQPSSRSYQYRRALAALHRMEHEGMLRKRVLPHNVTVFWVIP